MIDFYTWTKNIMILGAIIFLTKTKIYNWKKKHVTPMVKAK